MLHLLADFVYVLELMAPFCFYEFRQYCFLEKHGDLVHGFTTKCLVGFYTKNKFFSVQYEASVTGRDISREDMFYMMVYHCTSEAYDEGMYPDSI